MLILEGEDQRSLVGEPLDVTPPSGEALVAPDARVLELLEADERAQMLPDPRAVVRPDDGLDARPELRLGIERRVVLVDAGLRLHHLGEGPEADALAVGEGPPLPPPDDLRGRVDSREELGHEARLADPRHADDREELRLALSGGALVGVADRDARPAARALRRC